MSQIKTFQLSSPVPFPIQVRLIANSSGFPKVVMVPAPTASIPVAFPGMTLQFQIKMPNGAWSPTKTLPWKQGKMPLPKLF
jgi:hypothetical protein